MDNKQRLKLPELLSELRYMTGSLPPGTALPKQNDLCRRFGVTTYLLNQAVRELESEGLVRPVSGHGVFVKKRDASERRFLQVVFLDNPEILRFREFGLRGFLRVCGRKNIECRVSHVRFDDTRGLKALLNRVSDSSPGGEYCGAVISGYVRPATVRALEKELKPWVVFGDVFSREPMLDAASVCGDSFQGGKLACQVLQKHGCRQILLVNYSLRDEWCWTAENRAGVLAVAEECPECNVFLPKNDCMAEPREFEQEVKNWASEIAGESVGVLCSGHHAFHMAASVRFMLGEGIEPVFCIVDADETRINSPGVIEVLCSMELCAEAAVERLMAMRHGRKAQGRQCIPAYSVAQSVEEQK